MPLINIRTSATEITDTNGFLKKVSSKIAELTSKPEIYVMATLEFDAPMLFGGSSEDCCYIEVKSIGGINPSRMSNDLCMLINESLGVQKERIYINFEDIQAKNWGYNATTFG
ncbi:phenylpyruvate tautomerase MIF-related protein [Prochlorococcus marinus]|uniref:L-dopachrome isomerase n=1 Tax=Prochlorococcus marinus (strain MIT 9211) TaxID=93059 RepID=A9BB73_PROM4|nr:phenylpyruvate tautomerase MIF-related protein [Prochlorococcus marinus]ABX09085.1 Phenylpyruvate tautomerase [Prochlorococcus marinus str. MIT 9211]